ncbi:energy transducer TonB [Arcicella aurantiaca]|nr:TonB family protein [Arcicella aurantiaca]
MKKLLFLSILMSIIGIISFAQPVQKSSVSSSKTDSSAVVNSKKNTESQSSPMAGASKTEKVIAAVTTNDEDDFDEQELDELEISIAKAKAALGLKNVSTTTSSKSVSSRSRDVVSKVEEPRQAAPTTTYQSPTLLLNGRASESSSTPKADFKQVVLTDEEKKMYNAGGLKVNNIDEIDRDSIYISPSIPPSFSGGIEAMKAFFAQNLKVPPVLEGQEIKGRVFVRFVVRKDGRIDKVHLVKGPNDECNAEAIRVIKMMPNWLPASDKGDNVSAYHVLPISFMTKK